MLLAHAAELSSIQKPILSWHPHPDVWLIIGSLAAAYLFAVRRFSRNHPGREAVTRKQIFAFTSGIVFLWLASDYPIHDISENYLFSVHMVQHLLITLIAPPLLISGMPDWMVRKLFVSNASVHSVAKFVFAPLFAGILYNVVTIVTHWPAVVNGVIEHHWVHFFMHVLIFSSAFAMWMPVVNKCKDLPKLSFQFKILYLFLMSLLPTVPAAFITFADKPVYDSYADAPRLWNVSAIDDQQMAGAVMKVLGGGFLWAYVIGVFFSWYSKENPGRRAGGEIRKVDEVEKVISTSDAKQPI